jgi:hypothetical protein
MYRTPKDAEAEHELQLLESELKSFQEDRDPLLGSRKITNMGSIYISDLVPWTCLDDQVIWVDNDMEIAALADVRDGQRTMDEVLDDFESEYQEIMGLQEDDDDEDKTPLSVQIPYVTDDMQELMDAYDAARLIVVRNYFNGVIDVREVENGFSNLLIGAKTGGWLDHAERVVGLFRDAGYFPERAATSFSDLLLELSDMRGLLKGQVQPTQEEVQQCLREGAP